MKLKLILENIIFEESTADKSKKFDKIIYKEKGIGKIHQSVSFKRLPDGQVFDVPWKKIKQKWPDAVVVGTEIVKMNY